MYTLHWQTMTVIRHFLLLMQLHPDVAAKARAEIAKQEKLPLQLIRY